MSVRIIIDSSVNIPASQKDAVEIVPLKVCFGTQEYLDGVDLDGTRFYEMLVEHDTLPTTSQATPVDFEPYFQNVIDSGDDAVVITISSGFSGTYQSACIAASDFPEGRLFIVDSKSVSIGSGILAQLALRLREQGLSAAEIASQLDEAAKRGHVIAMIDTLEYLQKGGRISKAASIAGAMLSIKPVVYVVDGTVQILGKARGSKNRDNLLNKELERCGGIDYDMPILLGYTGFDDHLLAKYLDDNAHLWADYVTRPDFCLVGSAVGTHIGPGGITVAYFGKER